MSFEGGIHPTNYIKGECARAIGKKHAISLICPKSDKEVPLWYLSIAPMNTKVYVKFHENSAFDNVNT